MWEPLDDGEIEEKTLLNDQLTLQVKWDAEKGLLDQLAAVLEESWWEPLGWFLWDQLVDTPR